MNAEQIELLDMALLRCLDEGNTRFGLGATAMQMLVGRFGFTIKDPAQIEKRMDTMADPQMELVRPVAKGDTHSAVRTWRITPRGENYLRERGF